MSRAPIPGQTKTRLESDLKPEQCAKLHRAFLEDMSDMLLKVSERREVKLYLAYTPMGTENMFSGLVSQEFNRFLQQGADLGEKMNQALNFASQENEGQIIIGSDLPALDPSVLIKAVDLLAKKDIVLGPSKDGGYYLCGTNDSYPFLFNDIVWGQAEVLEATIKQIKKHPNLKYELVTACDDIDLYSELLDLKEKLQDKSAWEHYPKATAKVIEAVISN